MMNLSAMGQSMTMHHHTPRRGMLLLMVLSLLTLFLLMGTMFLVLATRARTTARAFMTATSDVQASPAVPRAVLNEALLMLVRGCQEDVPNDGVDVIPGESLLGDMYGADRERRPFLTETHDSFESDLFLTQAAMGAVTRPAYAAPGKAPEVDNDADGVLDGVWLDNLFPKMASSSGGTLSFRISYLVLDLDSRVNVNAHGGGSGDPLDGANPVGPADIDGSSLPPFTNGGWAKFRDGGSATGGGGGNLRKPPGLSPTDLISGRGGSAYGLRLDRNFSRPASLPKATPSLPNPFTFGELERVLRPFDTDWSTLPPRLASFLNDLEGSARWLVTTDSWDAGCWVGAPANLFPAPRAKFNVSKSLQLLTNPMTDAKVQQFATDFYSAIADVPGANASEKAQWAANVAEFAATRVPAPPRSPTPVTLGGVTVTGVTPSQLPAPANVDWQGIVSAGDLVAIPRGSRPAIDNLLINPMPSMSSALHSLVTSAPEIVDVLMFSQFVATVDADTAAGRFREPGRININTCGPVVRSLVGALPPAPGDPPHRSLWTVLRQRILSSWLADQTAPDAAAAIPVFDVRAVHPRRSDLNRLASVATVRSNVFAVWITVEVKDSAPDAGPPTCHRLFAIVDRSIPVLYEKGRNNDVQQIISLQRFLN